MNNYKTKAWIEAMRLRTLPVSVAGVLAGDICAIHYNSFKWLPATICLLFAILAQIASNFANEYYDYANGLDKKGRDGFRRGVTEGDLSPKSMRNATFLTLSLASALGLTLIFWGGWWLIPVGIAIAVFALAYSTGPYPLSHHGLGDIAVFIFFGLVPICFTTWLQTNFTPLFSNPIICLGAAVGLMSVNVLIVNNYRDADDDIAVNKFTSVVILGRKTMSFVYLADAIIAAILSAIYLHTISLAAAGIALFYLVVAVRLFTLLRRNRGMALNNVLKFTAISMLLYIILILLATLFIP